MATVKYLSPVHDEDTWATAASADWAKFQPVLEGAGNVAATLGLVPGVGTVAAGAAPILSALAKLKFGSVPQGVKGFDWSTGKVTFRSKEEHGAMQGVMWTLPKPMFELLGGRLTGSVAVSFIPSRSQSLPSNDVNLWLKLHHSYTAKLHHSYTAKLHHSFTAKLHHSTVER